VGQTGGAFCIRFNEQLQSFETYNTGSKFAQHLCECGHIFGRIEEIMGLLHVYTGSNMNTVEMYHVFRSKRGQPNTSWICSGDKV